MADVTDGLSNTIMISEAAITAGTGNGVNDAVIRGGIRINATDVFAPDFRTTKFSLCHAYAPDRVNYLTSSSGGYRNDLVGKMWGKGYAGTTGFHTILGPNSASCFGGNSVVNEESDQRMAVSATSNHPGGVNVGLSDGAVRFVSNNIDTGTLDAGSVKEGPSPYGVWGAMGSINGDEGKALP
jgi:hypothetical protein